MLRDMTTRLAQAKQDVDDAEQVLADRRDRLRQLAIHELQRGVSASAIAREVGMTRATISKWARDAGLSTPRATAEPERADDTDREQ